MSKRPLEDVGFGISIRGAQGVEVYGTNTPMFRPLPKPLPARGCLRLRLERVGLVAGLYNLDVRAHSQSGNEYDVHRDIYRFTVRSAVCDGACPPSSSVDPRGGKIAWPQVGAGGARRGGAVRRCRPVPQRLRAGAPGALAGGGTRPRLFDVLWLDNRLKRSAGRIWSVWFPVPVTRPPCQSGVLGRTIG